jgi:HlyD family secretion protein
MRTMFRRTATLLLCSSVFTLTTACHRPASDSWTGYIEGEYLYISSPLGGRITQMSVQAGQEIALAAPLFSLDKEVESAAMAEANARLQAARAQASNIDKGKRQEEIAVIHAQIQSAEAQAASAQNELQRQQQLIARGYISKAKIDDASTASKLALARVAELKAALTVAKLPARIDERGAANANAIAAEQALRQSTWRSQQKTEIAPEAGVVSEVFFRKGEVVNPGQAVLALLPPGHLKFRFYVPEAALANIRTGNLVEVRCDGCGAAMQATITRIANQAEYTPPVIYSNAQRTKLMFLVEARPEPALARQLHPGQPIDVKPLQTIAEKKS